MYYSYHVFVPSSEGTVTKAMFTLGLDYDQIIIELNMKWVHIN